MAYTIKWDVAYRNEIADFTNLADSSQSLSMQALDAYFPSMLELQNGWIFDSDQYASYVPMRPRLSEDGSMRMSTDMLTMDGGWNRYPTWIDAYPIATMADFAVSPVTTAPGIQLGPNGVSSGAGASYVTHNEQYIYTTGYFGGTQNSKAIHRVEFSTPGDITTFGAPVTVTLPLSDGAIRDIYVSKDGLKALFLVLSASLPDVSYIYSGSMTVPYDMSTWSQIGNKLTTNAESMDVVEDGIGTDLYYIEETPWPHSHFFRQFRIPPDWDLANLTDAVVVDLTSIYGTQGEGHGVALGWHLSVYGGRTKWATGDAQASGSFKWGANGIQAWTWATANDLLSYLPRDTNDLFTAPAGVNFNIVNADVAGQGSLYYSTQFNNLYKRSI